MTERIKHHFKTIPGDKAYSTSDGFIFQNKHDSEAHAAILKDKKVDEHERVDYEGELEDDAIILAEEKAKQEAEEAAKLEAEQKAKQEAEELAKLESEETAKLEAERES
jgi:hypothetical protein